MWILWHWKIHQWSLGDFKRLQNLANPKSLNDISSSDTSNGFSMRMKVPEKNESTLNNVLQNSI